LTTFDRSAQLCSAGSGAGAAEGAINVLEDPVNPQELAWIKLGAHWVVNIFEGGNIWLVNISAMGLQQQQRLGLVLPAAAPVQEEQQQQQQQLEAGLSGVEDQLDLQDEQDRSAKQWLTVADLWHCRQAFVVCCLLIVLCLSTSVKSCVLLAPEQ
jgi:hypothetical protein